MEAELNRLSWVDRNGGDLPPGTMEITLSIRVKKGSPEFRAILAAAKERRPVIGLSIEADEVDED